MNSIPVLVPDASVLLKWVLESEDEEDGIGRWKSAKPGWPESAPLFFPHCGSSN